MKWHCDMQIPFVPINDPMFIVLTSWEIKMLHIQYVIVNNLYKVGPLWL
jgi:hypothetical protein